MTPDPYALYAFIHLGRFRPMKKAISPFSSRGRSYYISQSALSITCYVIRHDLRF
jgi:hypothetical protein